MSSVDVIGSTREYTKLSEPTVNVIDFGMRVQSGGSVSWCACNLHNKQPQVATITTRNLRMRSGTASKQVQWEGGITRLAAKTSKINYEVQGPLRTCSCNGTHRTTRYNY